MSQPKPESKPESSGGEKPGKHDKYLYRRGLTRAITDILNAEGHLVELFKLRVARSDEDLKQAFKLLRDARSLLEKLLLESYGV